jgi:PAS domain S-box-containing protein
MTVVAMGVAGMAILASSPHEGKRLAGGGALIAALLCTGLFWRFAHALIRRAEESELKYRSIVEGATNGVFLMTDVFEECNPQACRIWGCEPGEMIGHTLAEFSPPTQPDGRSSAEAADEHIAAALAGTPQFFSWRHRRKDGGLVDTDISMKAIEVGGRKVLLLVARDVTEHRRAEEKLRERNEFIETILDNLPIGLGVLTFDDRQVRYMNRRIEEIIGWPRELMTDEETFWERAIVDPAYRRELVEKVHADWVSGDPSQMVREFTITKSSGDTAVILWICIPMIDRNLMIVTAQDFTERRQAEEALRQSEMHRFQLLAELNCAAEVQRKLLPRDPPGLPEFDIAAICLPARQVGGDFYDWQETVPGTVTLAFGDVMGKGIAAAMLMATVRATLRAVTRQNGPAVAVHLAEQALRHDLDGSESFVTLFLAQIDINSGTLTYVDCGHGFVFLRRRDGTVLDLLPRGLPLGISSEETYQEGTCVFGEGDALIVYSDGLLDARMEQAVNHGALSACLADAPHAREMVNQITALVPPGSPLPDDMTILVVRRQ